MEDSSATPAETLFDLPEGTEATPDPSFADTEAEAIETEIEAEEHYGVSKPKRSLIRAKIIHGKR